MTGGNDVILVTGADGFIGSHLVERLLLQGRSVRAFVLYTFDGRCGWLDKTDIPEGADLEIIRGNICDLGTVDAAMVGVRKVIHLAALIAIPYSYQAVQSYVATNIQGTVNLLEAARKAGVTRFIQTSTSEVYGNPQFVPMAENHRLNAQSPYAATKIASDQLALSYWQSFDLPVCVIRPFNAFGPRQSVRAVIPSIMVQVIEGAFPIRLGNLAARRDFTYVDDTVAGLIAAVDAATVTGETINLGSELDVSIHDLVDLIGGIAGVEVAVEQDSARLRPDSSEVDRLLSDSGKAKELLGWAPQHSGREGLTAALEKTYDWFSNPLNRDLYPRDSYVI